jgi:hypothetical protein
MKKALYIEQRISWKLGELNLRKNAVNIQKVANDYSKEFDSDFESLYGKPKKVSKKK